MVLTQDRLKELFNYSERVGEFTYKLINHSRKKAGKAAGTITSSGYIVISVDGKSYKAHRLAWLFVYGKMPVGQIDHINGDKRDNRISNLRDVPARGNSQNKKIHRDGKDLIGTQKNPETDTYYVQLSISGKKVYLGSYRTIELALEAYNEASSANSLEWVIEYKRQHKNWYKSRGSNKEVVLI